MVHQTIFDPLGLGISKKKKKKMCHTVYLNQSGALKGPDSERCWRVMCCKGSLRIAGANKIQLGQQNTTQTYRLAQ